MQYLRTKEAAQFLDVYPSTLRRLEERGLLAASRDHNGRRGYLLEDLQQAKRSMEPRRRQFADGEREGGSDESVA